MNDSNSNSVVNLGGLSKPANTLIEKVSDAVGGIAKPWQIKRVAKAEAQADLIRAETRQQITEIEQRALLRMVCEEGQKQENIENITYKALPNLSENAKPENVERDWLTNFFDKARLTSDEEMQSLWAKVLAGEANTPGSFSKRSVALIASLDKKDAELFTRFCTFCWMLGDLTALVFDTEHEIYNNLGINFSTLVHLDNIGLITFEPLSGYQKRRFSKYVTAHYYGKPITMEFDSDENKLETGKVLLTQAGKELGPICGSVSSEDYFNYVVTQWHNKGYILSSPIIAKPKT